MKKTFTILFLTFFTAGCHKVSISPSPGPVSCTMEAKLCPDGSYVGRTGPNCEFSACPSGNITTPEPKPVVCPQIAKACPDGSYVHPQGPNCEMPACPAGVLTSGIQGTVTIGPTCPVERIPPDPACADKPFQATISVETADAAKQITQFTTDSSGKFKVSLEPGVYLLVPQSGNMYPIGKSQTVTVEKNKFVQVNISYDSGIR